MIKYDPEENVLIDERERVLKHVSCPLEKKWDDLRTHNRGIEYEPVDVVYSDRARFCFNCQRDVIDLDGLSEDEIRGVCMAAPEQCVHATFPHPFIAVKNLEYRSSPQCPSDNIEGIRIIHSARTIELMNRAVEDGFNLLLKPIVQNEDIWTKMEVTLDDDGFVEINSDFRAMTHDSESLYFHYNEYRSPLPFAAYLVPGDLRAKERVFLIDLIEDLPGSWRWNQGDKSRRTSAYAIWNGNDFEIEELRPEEVVEMIG